MAKDHETSRLDGATLDQIHMFVAAADEGSFSAAGRKLHRVQSAVSYGIANLEEALGVQLFDRTSRVPRLSRAGEALLIEARALLDQLRALHQRARSMQDGLEAEVSLVVDACFPIQDLVSLSRWFQERYPKVSLRMGTEALGAVAARVHCGDFQLGVTGPEGWKREQFVSVAARRVALVPVVAASHELARIDGAIGEQVLQDEVQIVLSERSEGTAGFDFGVLSRRTWRVADLWTKLAFLRGGLGFGTMPEHMVAADLAAGQLVKIRPAPWEGSAFCLSLFAITDRSAPPLGPAAAALRERLTGEQESLPTVERRDTSSP